MAEPHAPDLPGFATFSQYMHDRGLIVRRLYEWPREEDEVGYWQVHLAKEELRFDGKVYMQIITVDDRDVIRGWASQWDTLVKLLEMGFARTLEENGVSDEDERIHEIRNWDQGPAAPLGRDPADVEFLLDVVTRLKEKERALEAELAWNWREGSEQRHVLQHIAEAQPTALKIIEENGFVFEDIGKEPGNWQHLAFTLYTEICEIDLSARRALGIEPGEEV